MSEHNASRGWTGTVLKLMGAGDYRLTVTARHEIGPHYLRLSFDAGGMLADHAVHPTMWIRVWFVDGDRLHRRGYTLVDPDSAADMVSVEFALHDGIASLWALLESIGDAPAQVFLEADHDDDKGLPVAPGADITWVDRKNAGQALLEAVRSAAFDAGDYFGWVACDNRTTRSVAKALREDFGIPRKSIKAQAYWVA
jgi:NADPH-dependent ferric siderophore reductase